jgi:translation elongation factor EF-Tu-like GTPase
MDYHVIEARIRYLTREEGGRASGVASGYRGQFYYANQDFDGFQFFPDARPAEFIALGRDVRAFVRFVSDRWEKVHKQRVHVGMPFEIREGNRMVGSGVVTRIDVAPSKYQPILDEAGRASA